MRAFVSPCASFANIATSHSRCLNGKTGRQAQDAVRICVSHAVIVRPHTAGCGRMAVNKERYDRWACRRVKILAKMQTIWRV